jgi:hypothetical protein
VQAQHGVQAVEAGAQVVELVRLEAALGEGEVGADELGEAVDLGVRAAHGRGGIGATEDRREGEVELVLLGMPVRQ